MIGLSMLESGEIVWINFMAYLRIVATPIGNLEDLSFRAKRTLTEADYILAEDTRVTQKLLNHYQIKTPTLSYHDHSGKMKVAKIKELLQANKNLALVSDAGTPGISDPGSRLIEQLRKESDLEITIESIPGPSALSTSLAIAGTGFDQFLFLGFLPHKKGRQSLLKQIIASEHSVVIYESKHRFLKLLTELSSLNKELQLVVMRELTKIHESVYQGSVLEVLTKFQTSPEELKGEFVVLIKK